MKKCRVNLIKELTNIKMKNLTVKFPNGEELSKVVITIMLDAVRI